MADLQYAQVLVFQADPRVRVSEAKIAKYQSATLRGILQFVEVVEARPPSSYLPKKERDVNLDTDIRKEDGITPVLDEPESSPEPEAAYGTTPRRMAPINLDDSDGSPLSSVPDSEPEDDPEYGKNFMGFYVMDSDGEKPAKSKDPAPPAKRQKPNPPAKTDATASGSKDAPTRGRTTQNRQRAPPASSNNLPQQSLPPLPYPVINIIGTFPRTYGPNNMPPEHVIRGMFQVLSERLCQLGGGPACAPPPPAPVGPQNAAAGASDTQDKGKGKAPVKPTNSKKTPGHDEELLLDAFDVDDSSDEPEDDEPEAENAATTPPTVIAHQNAFSMSGTRDTNLVQGIEFIITALRSWGENTIRGSIHSNWLNHNMNRQRQQQVPLKKGRGRPSKYETDMRLSMMNAPPPPAAIVNADLATTPEGNAIQAFQDLVDCGQFRNNAMIPVGLSTPISTVYKQIDKLINSGKSGQAPWQCMSYTAQIHANSILVAQWKQYMADLAFHMPKEQRDAEKELRRRARRERRAAEAGQGQSSANGKQPAQQHRRTASGNFSSHTPPAPSPATTSQPLPNGIAGPSTTSSTMQGASAATTADVSAGKTSSRGAVQPMSNIRIYHGANQPPNVPPQYLGKTSMQYNFIGGPPSEQALNVFGRSAFAGSKAPVTLDTLVDGITNAGSARISSSRMSNGTTNGGAVNGTTNGLGRSSRSHSRVNSPVAANGTHNGFGGPSSRAQSDIDRQIALDAAVAKQMAANEEKKRKLAEIGVRGADQESNDEPPIKKRVSRASLKEKANEGGGAKLPKEDVIALD